MTAEYSFEKKSIAILLSATIFLFILIFFLGLLIGLGMERSDPTSKPAVEIAESSAKDQNETNVVAAGQGKSENSELVKETSPQPASPEFKDVSPKSELPAISQPKAE